MSRVRTDLVKGSVWTLVAALSSVPMVFIANLIVVRSLGPAGLGTYGGYVVLVGIVTLALNLGVSDATVQWLAAAMTRGQRTEQEILVRRCSGFHVFFEGPVLAALVFALVAPTSIGYAVAGASGVWLTHALGTASVVMSATARNALAARLGILSGAALQLTIAGSAAATGSSVPVFALQTLVTALGPALSFVALDRRLRSYLLRPTLRPWVGREFAKYSAAAAVSGLLGIVVFGRSEVLILQAQGQLVAVGLFIVATGLASQITVPMDSLMGPLVPTAAGLVAAGPDRAASLLLRSMRVTALLGAFTVAVVVPGVALGVPVIYGADFEDARAAFLVLGVISCLQSLLVPVTAFALALRRAMSVAWMNAAGFVVDLTLALTLIPVIGLFGAVVANSLGQMVALILLGRSVASRLGIGLASVVGATGPFGVALVAVGLSAAVITRPNTPTSILLVAAVMPVAVLLIVLAARPSFQLPNAEMAGLLDRLPRRLRPIAVLADRVLPLSHSGGRVVSN